MTSKQGRGGWAEITKLCIFRCVQNKRAHQSTSMNGNISKELRMMGHTQTTQKNAARLGFSDNNDTKDPEDEVNDYLMRAIDARSIDRLRSEHCKSVLLSFKKASIERKVCKKKN